MSRRKSTFADAEEEGWGTQSRRGAETELDITPMIDVTFLLLIFFMVTSTMQDNPQFELPVAKNGVKVPADGALNVRVDTSDGNDGELRVLLDNQPVTLDELKQQVQEAYEGNQREVIIRADRDAAHGNVLQVMEAISAIEGLKFHVAVKDEPQY